MFLETLGASLLENILAGEGVIYAGEWGNSSWFKEQLEQHRMFSITKIFLMDRF